nr:MAG TPA: hypothetical protein [Caudoviricetes sp.]
MIVKRFLKLFFIYFLILFLDIFLNCDIMIIEINERIL